MVAEFWYRKGFKNPSVDLLFCNRASFSKEMMPATVGVEADVPYTDSRHRLSTIQN